jgi:toxin ParE1/3/4
MIKYTAHADADLDEIIEFHITENPEYANKIFQEIAGKLTSLEKNPSLGKSKEEVIFHLRSFPAKKYIIFYTPIKDGIEVFRIIHSSRDIEGLFNDFFENLDQTNLQV